MSHKSRVGLAAAIALSCGKSQPPAGGNIPEGGACQRSLDCQGSLSCVDQKCTQVTPAAVDQSACQCPNGRPCSASGRCLESGCRSGLCDLNGNPDDGCEACCPTAGGREVCDGVDNNCDGKIDEGVTTTFYLDADEDGFGDDRFARAACVAPKSHVPRGGDCNDNDPAMRPGLPEQCDGKDNDCNGQVDDNVTSALYADRDRDGYGDPAAAIQGCVREGFVSDKTDCDDSNPLVNPGRADTCDYLDNNCDGKVDEGVRKAFYADNDRDGFGDPGAKVETCAPTFGLVSDNTDCNDLDATVHPGRSETCDTKDNDCNGQVDEGVTKTFYRDADGDGFGDTLNTVVACVAPAGFIVDKTDCDDVRPDAHPGAQELCNTRDDDCDGIVDGQTRPCSNACGTGTETCRSGLFGGCTAPAITQITTGTTLKGQSPITFDCLLVSAGLTLDADIVVQARNWIRVASSISAGPRARLEAGSDIAFQGSAELYATDVTLDAKVTVSMESATRWYIQGAVGRAYSSGGGPACQSGQSATGGAGGARGGTGGQGGACGVVKVLPTPGAGGTAAQNGADGCCSGCTSAPPGGSPSGGSGGAPMSGAGGGGNGGAGGTGSSGSIGGTVHNIGPGGAAEPGSPAEPTVGGGGGGAGGAAITTYVPEICNGGGGAGGGFLRVVAAEFVNAGGIIYTDGQGGGARWGCYGVGGGGGGGGGGTLVFRVGRYDNRGVLSAIGGAGAGGQVGGCYACTDATAGGGGGGGGGRIYFGGPLAGGTATIVTRGTLLVAGGSGGTGACGRPAGQPGANGWVFPP